MQQTVLMRSIERLVVAGETAGMSVEVMIHLLKAGMSVKLYLTSSGRNFAPPRKILLLPAVRSVSDCWFESSESSFAKPAARSSLS